MSLDNEIIDGLDIGSSVVDTASDFIDAVGSVDGFSTEKKPGFLDKVSSAFSPIKTKLNDYIDNKGLTEQKELLFFELRDNLILIILLTVSLILGGIVTLQAPVLVKDYEKKVLELSSLQKEILTYQKKTQGNERYKSFSDLLQYGIKLGDDYFPAGGYLTEFKKLYPTKENLNFGTFTEGWTSDFITWRGEKIRIPKDILKEYKLSGENEVDADYKTVTYNLKLEGNKTDIDKYLSMLSGLKLVKNLSEIKEKPKDGSTMTTDVTISFYLKK